MSRTSQLITLKEQRLQLAMIGLVLFAAAMHLIPHSAKPVEHSRAIASDPVNRSPQPSFIGIAKDALGTQERALHAEVRPVHKRENVAFETGNNSKSRQTN